MPRHAGQQIQPLAMLHAGGVEVPVLPEAVLAQDAHVAPSEAADEVVVVEVQLGRGHELLDRRAGRSGGELALLEQEIPAQALPDGGRVRMVLERIAGPRLVEPVVLTAPETAAALAVIEAILV